MGSVNGGFIPDDARSHVSSYSMHANSKGQPVNLVRSRSLADGQSQRSMSQMSGRYLPSHGLHGMPMSMPIGTHGMSMAGLQVPNMGLGMSRSGTVLPLSLLAMAHRQAVLNLRAFSSSSFLSILSGRCKKLCTRLLDFDQ